MNEIFSRLPKSYYEKGISASMFGIPVKDLTKEELISCIGYLSQTIENQRIDHSKNLQTLSSLRKKDL